MPSLPAVLHPSPTDMLKVMGVEVREDMIIGNIPHKLHLLMSTALIKLLICPYVVYIHIDFLIKIRTSNVLYLSSYLKRSSNKIGGCLLRNEMINICAVDTQQTHTKAPVSKAILELHPMNLYCLTEEMGEGSTSLYIAGVQLDQRLF